MLAQATPVYRLKSSPYSSHSLLIARLPEDGSGKSVLDVGCGDGYLGSILAERGFAVTGIEKSGGFTGSFPGNVTLIEADLEEGLPPLSSRYDFVLCGDILEHLRQPGSLLRDLRRALSPSSVLIASLPNSGNIYFRLQVAAGNFPQHDKGLFDRTHLRFFTFAGWKTLLETSGYSLLSVHSSAIPVSLAVPPHLEGSGWVRAAERVCYEVARCWKTLFAYQFVVTARMRIDE